jgi:hypothetical protein
MNEKQKPDFRCTDDDLYALVVLEAEVDRNSYGRVQQIPRRAAHVCRTPILR